MGVGGDRQGEDCDIASRARQPCLPCSLWRFEVISRTILTWQHSIWHAGRVTILPNWWRMTTLIPKNICLQVILTMLVANPRTLLNIGLVFHWCNQMCNSKRLTEYAALFHYQNAANQRFITKHLLKKRLVFCLTGQMIERQRRKSEPSIEFANFCPSPVEPSTLRSTRTVTSTPISWLPCTGGITGTLPEKGK